MKTKKKNYTELYNRALRGEKIPCWIDHNFIISDETRNCRDICQCKKWNTDDIVFSVRGSNYGGVESYMGLEDNEKLPYFIRFCEKYNVEYVV